MRVFPTKDLASCLDWYSPVPMLLMGQDPLDHLAPYWYRLIKAISPYRDDSLVAADWTAAVGLLDAKPLPTAPEVWNLRWRQFVVAIWRLLEQHERRLRVRDAAERLAVLNPGRQN